MSVSFWKMINNARDLVKSHKPADLSSTIREIIYYLESSRSSEKEIDFFQRFIKTYDIENLHTSHTKNNLKKDKNIPIDDYVTHVNEGISLITCCMNRNENLVKAIPSWIACKEISEIIIVDWSSAEPVHEFLQKNKIHDHRIKVVRVDDQPRWVLSYAFNIGFRVSAYDKILKTDADIIIHRDFFEKNILSENKFISGDWRTAEKGQEHINGFFYVSRESVMSIKGFNEYITTYGWDDDDIYDRLEKSGSKRSQVDTTTIYHIPHADELRIGNTGSKENELSPLALLHNSTKFKIRSNRFIANTMPPWTHNRVFLPFLITDNEPGFLRVKKNGDSIHYVPPHIQDDASYYTELELTSWQAGLRVYDLDKNNLRKLLSKKPLDTINQLDIEIAIYNQASDFKLTDNYLLLRAVPEIIARQQDRLLSLVGKLSEYFALHKWGVVLLSNARSEIAEILPAKHRVAFVPEWRNLGTYKKIEAKDVHTYLNKPQKDNIYLTIDDNNLHEIESIFDKSYPQFFIKKERLYIDAQHGLGNRLRALASGAAIAAATDRELVVVWEPDHHCLCRIDDLFDYHGAVIHQSFVKEAKEQHMSLFNYMEIEEGAQKGASIFLEKGRDAYARSAYTFNSDHSTWDKENIFLRNLTPTQQVKDLVTPFNVTHRVGAHVRMEAGKGLDHNTYDSVENWTQEGHDQLHYWRDKSHYSNFIKRIDQLISDNQNLKLFLATDLPETYQIFQSYYGDNLAFLPRTVYDRSKEQIIYALADAILLSGCNRLLGSTWSSFSELAMRLSTTYSKIEMSGNDF